MNANNAQLTDSEAKKVTTTIRFDGSLHDALTDFVHDLGKGKQPRDRPSKDSVVQAAVRALLDRADAADGGLANPAIFNPSNLAEVKFFAWVEAILTKPSKQLDEHELLAARLVRLAWKEVQRQSK